MKLASLITCGFFLMAFCPKGEAKSLENLYKLALQHSATIKNMRLSQEIAKEEKAKALATVLPTVTANSSSIIRDEVANVGPFGEGFQHSANMAVNQTIFRGGAEYYALKIAKNFPEIAEHERLISEIQLYTQLAEQFYSALRLRNEKNILEEQNKILTERVKTLERRARIGISKPTEVLAAKSNQARVESEYSSVINQLELALQQIKNLTGEMDLTELSDNKEITKVDIPDIWSEKLLKNPSLIAAELQLKNLKHEVGVTEGNFLPRLDLDGRYFLERAGILRDSDWEITINASWNLFAGGADKSERRIKILQAHQQEAMLSEIKTNLQNDYKVLRQNFKKQKSIILNLKKSVDLARQNYRAHLVEVDQGLINHLDLLRVLEDYLQAQRNYEQQIFSANVMWVQLRALVGVVE